MVSAAHFLDQTGLQRYEVTGGESMKIRQKRRQERVAAT
jgi:hypothetical protein